VLYTIAPVLIPADKNSVPTSVNVFATLNAAAPTVAPVAVSNTTTVLGSGIRTSSDVITAKASLVVIFDMPFFYLFL